MDGQPNPWPLSGAVGVFSSGILRIRHLEAFLAAPVAENPRSPEGLAALAGWGQKPGARKARDLAQAWNLPYLALEDGFYRSLDLGARGAEPLSLVLDPVGVYYDATRPSLLEDLLEGRAPGLDDPALAVRATALMARVADQGLSKYNQAPDLAPDFFPPAPRGRVLVVDQTLGDLSVSLGRADAATFQAMLEAALAENPGAEIWLKPHPDVLAGKKRGHLPLDRPGVRVLTAQAAPHSVLRHMDRVYTVSSQLGFEALLHGLPVTCFGLPFYAGWGATDDRQACARRTRRRGPAEIFAAACLLYARYVDPFSGRACDLERVLDVLAFCRERDAANAGITVCLGFQRWKRPFARAFLGSTRGGLRFCKNPARAVGLARDLSARLVVWAAAETPDLAAQAAGARVDLWRMEDGFLRSTGLGSDFARPYSLILDRGGIYYDPSRASDLEALLERGSFPAPLLDRAAALRRAIVERGLTKYNQAGAIPDLSAARGRTIILVPGQVADDASVRRGGAGVSGNLDLLRLARQARPGAFLIYKPHPDVLAGNRKGRVPRAELTRLCDLVVTGASMAALLPLVQEVHTLSSLSGFEALLRGLCVHTYGAPFYAGWGLTRDRATFPRRNRRASLDELVAAALLLYPRYFDWESGLACPAETVLARLEKPCPQKPKGVISRRLTHWLEYFIRVMKAR